MDNENKSFNLDDILNEYKAGKPAEQPEAEKPVEANAEADDFSIANFTVNEEQPLDDAAGVPLSSVATAKKKGKKPRKGKGCMTVAIWLAVIGTVSVVLSSLVIMAFIDVIGITFGADVEREIVIPEGASTQKIAEILDEAEAIRYPLFFRIYSKLTKADGTYQYGRYYVKSSYGYEGIVNELQQIGARAEEVKVTIPERSNLDQIMAILEKNNVCTKADFKSAMAKSTFDYEFIKGIPVEKVHYLLEGYLYADTYIFYKSDGEDGVKDAKRAIDKLLSELDNKLTDEMYAQAEKMGYSMHEIMTMASIIELEASGNPTDMAKVAQVFYNRLNWDEPKLLGSTPTAEYPYGSGRYDTNKNEGLPPGPLCSPSFDAIKAALYPDTSVKATYFVTDKYMKFYYTNSLSEHNAIIRKLKNQGIWEY
ncbi:MAG: endolytic transglycosylase MltG [Clostridia bacterium]|nr:endolytic transglycosylase MltG [Clostridia bacterium]